MLPIVRVLIVSFLLGSAGAAANAATVRGSVNGASGGAALPGAVVSAYGVSGALAGTTIATEPSGQYILTLPSGTYRLLAYDPSGVYATAFYGNADSFESTALVPVVEGSPVDANFALPAGFFLSGAVLGTNQSALTSAVVEAYNLSGTRRGFAAANASGQYSLVLPAGGYKIFAYDANGVFAGEFAGNSRSFADAQVVQVVTPAPATTDLTFVLDKAAKVNGSVVDAATRAPLGGKVVYAYTASGSLVSSVTTSTGGAFQLSLGPASYRLVAADPDRVYAPAFYPNSRSFEGADVIALTAGEERSGVTVNAERGGILTARVAGNASFLVTAYNGDGTQHTSTVKDAGGDFRLVVAPGSFKLAAIDPEGIYATQFHQASSTFAGASPLTVLVGQSVGPIQFAPLQAGRVSGTVRSSSTQQGLSGMTVAAYDAAGASVAEAASGPDGKYLLAIAPGQYRLVAFDARFDYATAYLGGATSYEASVPLDLQAGGSANAGFVMTRGVRVTGNVRQESGEGIDGAEVFALDSLGDRVAGAVTRDGAFTLVVLPATYTFLALDPQHRYSRQVTAQPLVVGATPPLPITIWLRAVSRRRATRS